MEIIKVYVKREDDAKLPVYATEGAAGMDVHAFIEKEIEIKPMERVLVPTGLSIEIPFGYEVEVRPRSGLAIKHGITLLNTPGTIDSDYRGEVKIIMINLSKESYSIKPNERIGQFVLKKVYKIDFEEVRELSSTERGSGGFGHTGKH